MNAKEMKAGTKPAEPTVGIFAAELSGIDKRYGMVHALKGVSISFNRGDVHAIAGENGAGKSTLMKILSGVIGSYEGSIEIEGERCQFDSIRDAERHGVFLVPQELNVVPELRVGEYLYLNREPRRWGMVDTKTLWTEAARWLAVFKLQISPLLRMGDLSTHQQQLVSIARAMTQGVKLLILDEPTSNLTERETELMFGQISDLHRHGVTTIYISHRLHEFERIANVVTVMRDGAVVDHFRLEGQKDTPRRVVKAMVGRDLTEMYPKVVVDPGRPILSLRNWTIANGGPGRPYLVEDLDMDVRAGEVVGIFGLLGSGAFDLTRSLFGAHESQVRGTIQIDGRTVSVKNPRDAIRSGIAYVPAERKRDGLIESHSITSNMTLAALSRLTRFGVLDRAAELTRVQTYVKSLKVKCGSVEQPISQLSGGNQQKVIAAKWLLTEPDVFILEEPTRGVDINARVDFYALVNELAAAGKAIIIVSTDLPEVLGMADRVMAMLEGNIVREWRRGEATEEDVMTVAAGGSRQ
ncbi:sugar ABC transporter ATP-binding protein [Agrobacterium tumefaciens]|uniref:sugar ABC transporter ATP-binding protein n=1 Tax=Agrobacterium tumefaciens TaxID=358 RepID=UPI0015747424|nr:sugar ABC transporter ATP-binding protein [Agrobacterium tumefaciens]NTA19083.1 sugar ABC transporter ATP-binding protein [Agrobacterium tumefaciens]WCK74363.1 sugar ABC transporter ATP-binding protein [Agrobacterium tumefaciens]